MKAYDILCFPLLLNLLEGIRIWSNKGWHVHTFKQDSQNGNWVALMEREVD